MCNTVKYVWSYIESILACIYNKDSLVLSRFTILFGFIDTSAVSDISNMVIGLARWEIWKMRCKLKFDDTIDVTTLSLIGIIRYKLDLHINTLLSCRTLPKCVKALKLLQNCL